LAVEREDCKKKGLKKGWELEEMEGRSAGDDLLLKPPAAPTRVVGRRGTIGFLIPS